MAIAAVAALFLCAASSAQAAPVEFTIDMSKSWLFQQTEFDLTGLKLGKFKTTTQVGVASTWGGAMGTGSDTSPIWGSVWADLSPGTITLLPSSALNLTTTGAYAPFDTAPQDPPGPPAVGTTPGNFGLAITALPLLYLRANVHDANMTFAPMAPIPLVGPAFGLVSGEALVFTEGRLALVSSSGNGTDGLGGDPAAIFSTGTTHPSTPLGPDIGSWDGTTLTIPIGSYVAVPTVIDVGGTPTTITIGYYGSGMIVATPKIPEPSTMVLLGFGIVGLMTCAWRYKKRKNLVG